MLRELQNLLGQPSYDQEVIQIESFQEVINRINQQLQELQTSENNFDAPQTAGNHIDDENSEYVTEEANEGDSSEGEDGAETDYASEGEDADENEAQQIYPAFYDQDYDYGGEYEESNLEDDKDDIQNGHRLFNSPLLSQALYSGSQVTLKDALLLLLQWQSENEMSVTAFEHSLKLLAYVFLPQPNTFPTTIYQLNKLIGFNLSDYEEHVCVNDCCLYEKLDRDEWEDHCDQSCPNCGQPRFKKVGNNLSPQKKFYRVPIAEQIENMTNNPQFMESLLKMKGDLGKNLQATDSYWGAKLGQEDLLNEGFMNTFTSLFYLSLGIDGVQCFKEAEYSVTPIAIKIWNLHPDERTSGDFVFITALIPGNS